MTRPTLQHVWTALRWLAALGLWVVACPWMLWVSGYQALFGVWLLGFGSLGYAVWRAWQINPTDLRTGWRAVFGPKPWAWLLILSPAGACAALYPWLAWRTLAVLFPALGPGLGGAWAALALCLTLLAAITPTRPWQATLFFMVAAIATLAARTLLGPTMGRGMDVPVVLVPWLGVALALCGGWLLRQPRALLAAALVNLLVGAALVEFYMAPLDEQRAMVTAQKGAEEIAAAPGRDLRWITEGCDNDHWIGARLLTGMGRLVTLIHTAGKDRAIGGASSDNGAVDCALRLVMVGDQSPGGRLHVLDERSGEPIWQSPNTEGASGISPLVYLPDKAWLLAGRESEAATYFVQLKNPKKPVLRVINQHATHMVPCRAPGANCVFAVQPGAVVKLEGEDLKDHRRWNLPTRTLGPDVALDEAGERVYVSDFLTGRVDVFESSGLYPMGETIPVPVGVRYMVHWPHMDRVWGANFLDGWLYSFKEGQPPRREIYGGKKARWLNLSRDGKYLLWCAASACYQYNPGE